MAARPRSGGGWEVAVIRQGRLVAAATTPPDPRPTLAALATAAPPAPSLAPSSVTPPPTEPAPGPTPVASAEETERLIAWLERPEVRLVECPRGWSYPVRAAARFAPLLESLVAR